MRVCMFVCVCVCVCVCSWYIIMPVLSQCVSEATGGCNTRQIADWLQTVAQFNATMNAANCSAGQ